MHKLYILQNILKNLLEIQKASLLILSVPIDERCKFYILIIKIFKSYIQEFNGNKKYHYEKRKPKKI